MFLYKHGENIFDPQKATYSTPEKTSRLSKSETKILQYLIDNCGEIVSRETLLQIGWPGKFVVPNSLNVSIGNLRKVFRQDRAIIITIKDKGFTIKDDNFIRHQIEPEAIREFDPESNEVQYSANDKEQEISPRQSLPTWKIVCYSLLILVILFGIALGLGSWKRPPCVTINSDLTICGDIEFLNIKELP
ncbi:conserved hypothetical protein [Photobacterium leiognathi lrivu.4.1]|uniref:OmpR/PhoB-type domain-containing protein n=1 Tax=Photobacterium leiognathi lrivu.4.1 TaxID=1248232 RepID=V5ENK0_PHOLE|nr:winged helix-turn-helix domain-containing protein [Photobacterium leiognathi]GAD31336.1 conserved hypothetical protein [Photobacterium leiognathi lrivu.4.1]